MNSWTLGIIGGSGLYALDSLEDPEWRTVETPWGPPSDQLLTGHIGNVRLVFLPRHGRGHPIPPNRLNSRANIDALKRLGVTDVLAISAVGSLCEELPPGRFVAVDQFIDRTQGRASSFFDTGCVAHVSMADPVCERLQRLAVQSLPGRVTLGGTYLAMEGPQFSTRAESRLYRQWGAQVIGMTAFPEARLAREAELPYALVGMVTDYDSWRTGASVDIADIMRVLAANAAAARALVTGIVQLLQQLDRAPSPLDRALDHAILTAPAHRDPALVARLDAVAGRVLRSS